MFNQGLVIAHHSYNLIESSFKDGFSHYCNSTHTIDYMKLSAEKGTKYAEESISTLIIQKKVEIILCILPIGVVHLDPLFLKRLSHNTLIMSIFLDLELYFESIDRYYAQCSDLVIVVGSKKYQALFSLYEIHSHHTASLYNSNFYKNNFLERTIDVLFIGDITRPNRREYINYLDERGINVISYGQGTKNGFVTNEQMVKLYNQAKITLNFEGTHNNNKEVPYTKKINSRISQIKGRITEASMCGSFVLTEETHSKDERYCSIKHIDTFNSKDHLYTQINHYLDKKILRDKKAHNAYLHSLDNYDAVKGMLEPMKTIKNIKNKTNKTIELDDDFLNIYTTQHFYMFLDLLISKNIKHALHEFKILYKQNFNISFDGQTFSFLKELLSSRYYLYRSRHIKKNMHKYLDQNKISNIVIYAGGEHTESLLNTIDKNIESKITGIYDRNEELEGKNIKGITITSSTDILKVATNILISSFAFEEEIAKELREKYPSSNIIKIYNNSKKDMFFKPRWYDIFLSTVNKK